MAKLEEILVLELFKLWCLTGSSSRGSVRQICAHKRQIRVKNIIYLWVTPGKNAMGYGKPQIYGLYLGTNLVDAQNRWVKTGYGFPQLWVTVASTVIIPDCGTWIYKELLTPSQGYLLRP